MTKRSLLRRLRALISRTAVERELGDEVRFHLQMEIDELMRVGGLSRAEAERQAHVRFGGIDRHTESHRDERGTRWIEDGIADLKYAVRALRRTPAFTTSTILVLTLGIGASTAIFSAVNTVIISHLPYADDGRLIRIYNSNSPTNRWSLSVVDFHAIEAQKRTLSDVGAMTVDESPVSAGSGEATVMRVSPTSAGMFTTLGVRASVGRVIQRSDEVQAAPPVTVISDRFATRAFGSASAALGKTLDIEGRPVEVVGVLPAGRRELAGFTGDLWPAYQPRTPTRRGPFGIVVIGRLNKTTTLDATARDLTSISRRVYPLWSTGFKDTVARFIPIPLRDAIIRDAPKTLWMFAGAAALLLLTAVMNVTNLMLARMTTRTREISLRAVLGASRGRLVRLVVAETTLLSAVGATGGIVAAWAILKLLVASASTMPRIALATIDGRALAFAVSVGLVIGVVIGLYPVLTLLGKDSRAAQSGNREIGLGRHSSRLRGALVAAQFALALPLLAGAGQLLHSIVKLQSVDPGFDPARIAYTRAVLPRARYDSAFKVTAYWTRAIADVARVPGVAAVGYTTELPPSDVGNMNDFLLQDSPVAPGAPEPMAPWLIVSPGFFDAIGARLIAGRMFTAADTGAPSAALIVSESFVKHFSPDRPIARRSGVECSRVAVPRKRAFRCTSSVS